MAIEGSEVENPPVTPVKSPKPTVVKTPSVVGTGSTSALDRDRTDETFMGSSDGNKNERITIDKRIKDLRMWISKGGTSAATREDATLLDSLIAQKASMGTTSPIPDASVEDSDPGSVQTDSARPPTMGDLVRAMGNK